MAAAMKSFCAKLLKDERLSVLDSAKIDDISIYIALLSKVDDMFVDNKFGKVIHMSILGDQNFGIDQARSAVVDIFTLAFSDMIFSSSFSTLGY